MWFSKGSILEPGNVTKMQIPPLLYPTQNWKLWNGPVFCTLTITLGDINTY